MTHFSNHTKIVATMGPASLKKETLVAMVQAGVNVCRLNFSHGTAEDHQHAINMIREINAEYQLNIGILADLQGPKIRIGMVKEGGMQLVNGDIVYITTKECIAEVGIIYISYPLFPQDVKAGEIILLDDGKLQLQVVETNSVDQVICRVQHGGLLTSRKGVNLPNTKVSIPSLTPEDRKHLEFALENNVEWIGLSFVRTAEDIEELRALILKAKSTARIIAKVEKPEAIQNIDAIIRAADAVMVARGDLGVEVPMESVPVLQKMIVGKCRAASKPVIVATQMIESMIVSPRPTRAEVNDVANSVLDGADAVMLSGETSVGQFPVIVIETMSRIIRNVEELAYPYYDKSIFNSCESGHIDLNDALCGSAVRLAEKINACAIVSMTMSGYTAFEISSQRPKAPTFIFTANESLPNVLSLVWGVRAFFYDQQISTDQTIADVNELLKAKGLIATDDVVINTASVPIGKNGKTNMLKVGTIQ